LVLGSPNRAVLSDAGHARDSYYYCVDRGAHDATDQMSNAVRSALVCF
jgi:hypothetical protein